MVAAQFFGIVGDIANLQHLHPALHAAQKTAFLIAGKIMAQVAPQRIANQTARLQDARCIPCLPTIFRGEQRQILKALGISRKRRRDILGWQYKINQAAADRAVGHIGIARRAFRTSRTSRASRASLSNRQAAMFLDGLDAKRAISPEA